MLNTINDTHLHLSLHLQFYVHNILLLFSVVRNFVMRKKYGGHPEQTL